MDLEILRIQISDKTEKFNFGEVKLAFLCLAFLLCEMRIIAVLKAWCCTERASEVNVSH